MSDHNPISITEAEVLGVCGGMDDATGQPVVVLTLRPNTGSWSHINYALHPDNARSLLDRLVWVFETSPTITGLETPPAL